MRDCTSFPCKAKAATESHYQQPYVELQVSLGDCEKLSELQGPVYETFYQHFTNNSE